MTNGRKTLTTLALVLAGSLLLLPDAALAKKPKKLMRCKLGKSAFKSNVPGSPNGALLAGGNGWLMNAGQRKGLKSLGQLSLTCEAPGGIVAGNTYTCGGGYIVTALRPGAVGRGWTTNDQIQATVTSFDGTNIVGTFEGQLDQVGDTNPPGDGPLPVAKGKFSIALF